MDILLDLVMWIIDHAVFLAFVALAGVAICGMLYAAAGCIDDCLEDWEDDEE